MLPGLPQEPKGLPFQIYAPGMGVWMDKSAPEGRQWRIGGLITTDSKDRQKETVIQKGLDFSEFFDNGWFNDNHSKDTDSPVGYPQRDSLRYINKGEMCPDGKPAPGNGHWAEGYLLDSDRGRKIRNFAQSLQKAGDERRLGFSIEGSIQKRTGSDRKTIAKAKVRNVAVTNCPVNTDTRMEMLVKSLQTVEQAGDEGWSPEQLWKALGMGTGDGAGPATQPAGPQTGATAGQVLAPESLERKKRKDETQKAVEIEIEANGGDDDDEKENAKKSLTPELAWAMARERFPFVSAQQVGRLVEAARLLKARRAI